MHLLQGENDIENINSSSLLYECPAETRLTVYRRFSILNLGEIAGTSDRRNLVHWTSELEFNWSFTFWLLVLLHWKSFKCIEVLFSVIIRLFARPKFDFEPEGELSKKMLFLFFFKQIRFLENHQRMEAKSLKNTETFWKFYLSASTSRRKWYRKYK